MRLESHTIVVTGGAAGLGKSMARAFASEGADVVCVDHRESVLSATVSELADEPGSVADVVTDVRSWEAVQRLVETAEQSYGGIDVWVNNAGVQQRTAGAENRHPVVDVPVEIWDAVIETNLRGAFLCTKAILPRMLERDNGRIIHVSSGAGRAAKPNRSPYVASKFGLEGFHESLSLELDGTGVDSVTLRPPGGGVYTESRSHRSPDTFAFDSPAIIAEPAVLLAAGEGRNGGRYVGTEDGSGYTTYS